MVNTCCRPLYDKLLSIDYVKGVLDINEENEIREAARIIASAEMYHIQVDGKSTLDSKAYRDYGYQEDYERERLREQIVKELITKKRPFNDDNIKLGTGGALPRDTKITAGKQAYFITGLPSSGKSTIANKISNVTGSMIVDSDYAKRKFPEYADDFGASLVHDESTLVTIKGEYNVLQYCIVNDYNIVIPKIGYSEESILELAEPLKSMGYDIHLTLVSLDRKKSTIRAYKRYLETKRYVPLSLIFDEYSNDPILTYYRIRNNPLLSSYGKISTDVPSKSIPPIFIEGTTGNPALLFN